MGNLQKYSLFSNLFSIHSIMSALVQKITFVNNNYVYMCIFLTPHIKKILNGDWLFVFCLPSYYIMNFLKCELCAFMFSSEQVY